MDLLHQVVVSIVAEQQDGGRKMLVEIWGPGVGGERAALASSGRHQKKLSVSGLHVRREDRGCAGAIHWLAENEITVGEVEMEVVLVDLKIVDAVALGRIQLDFTDATREFSAARSRIRNDRDEQAASSRITLVYCVSLLRLSLLRR
jgi:hypothetical protein